jgi:hypothetical protein
MLKWRQVDGESLGQRTPPEVGPLNRIVLTSIVDVFVSFR